LSVVYDQVGSPTYAKDLAEVIIKIITNNNENYGVYHYSNEGVASWYDFAKAIFDESNTKINLLPIKSEAYPLPAKRPSYSVLDKEKIKNTLDISIPYWRDSLKKCLENFN
ncbi:MAG: sugar nucleotide-binding protein, partial [Flavobacteriaceae bacterium]